MVEARQEVPLLPKVAFALIRLASLLGALFTGLHLGLAPWAPARLSEKARRLLGWV
ncbi:hypothetical protein [Thermus islandicus]|uniref:hypothetical protein n=1 Tax=Thermus islandicus TaxID=540988 RepID=UPI0003B59799|nr:hypothetical protein [Thermus islandicus]